MANLIHTFKPNGTSTRMAEGIRAQVLALGLGPVWKNCYTAYLLATVKHETAGTFQPISEFGGKKTRYAPYYGRGFVQLTWLKNYQKYSKILNMDLVAAPDTVKDPDVALFILVHGSYFGVFSGVGFEDFPEPDRDDFVTMRKIINGKDKATLIAGYANEYLTHLEESNK